MRILRLLWTAFAEGHRRNARDFRRFVTRHETAFTILGALVVFCGFVVKEFYEDKNLALAGAMGAASNLFVVRSELESINLRLGTMTSGESKFGGVLFRAPSGTPTLEELHTLLDLERLALQMRKASFDTADALYKQLPHASQTLAAERERAVNSVSRLEVESKDHAELFERIKKEGDDTTATARKDLALLVAAADFSVGADVNLFGQFALAEAEFARTVASIRADLATTVSYILFVVGWILGLVGKLLKLPGPD